MKKYILLIVIGLATLTGFAHGTETSSIVLAEKENNVWVLQISASLTAFQQEINTHFSETPYETPEQFQEMVLQHIKNNLYFHFNGEDYIILSQGVVKLGHETKVLFELTGIPADLKTIKVTNTSFSDIYKSKSLLVILKEGINKNKFILEDSTNFSASLTVVDNALVEIQPSKAALFSWPLVVVFLGLIGAGVLVNRYSAKKATVY